MELIILFIILLALTTYEITASYGLFETEKDYQLNLYTHHLEGEWGSPCINLQLLYFGFYPKLKDKEIVVNLIYE